MFERHTEKLRRVIFFARYESSQFGAWSIETADDLTGGCNPKPHNERRYPIRFEQQLDLTRRIVTANVRAGPCWKAKV